MSDSDSKSIFCSSAAVNSRKITQNKAFFSFSTASRPVLSSTIKIINLLIFRNPEKKNFLFSNGRHGGEHK